MLAGGCIILPVLPVSNIVVLSNLVYRSNFRHGHEVLGIPDVKVVDLLTRRLPAVSGAKPISLLHGMVKIKGTQIARNL